MYYAHYLITTRDAEADEVWSSTETYPIIGHDGTTGLVIDKDGFVRTVRELGGALLRHLATAFDDETTKVSVTVNTWDGQD